MEKEIIENLCENLKWYERIIIRLFKKIFLKIYHDVRLKIVNSTLL